MPKIVCVVPSCRPEAMQEFRKAWKPLFEKHAVDLVTVWDGEYPTIQINDEKPFGWVNLPLRAGDRSLFCRWTDACRNLGFVQSAMLEADHILTLDDDCLPRTYDLSRYGGSENEVVSDPIQAHLDVLQKRVSTSWMNTAHDTDIYLRGVPYNVRNESPVMLSHGVWVGVPDLDGETQLKLEGKHPDPDHPNNHLFYDGVRPQVPYSLHYYVGPIPRDTGFPISGMNVMIRKEALPYFYFAPMGPDSGVPDLHRFSDIWMGMWLLSAFAEKGWAAYTGGSTILHTRLSNAAVNYEKEKLGRQWNEMMWDEKWQTILGCTPLELCDQSDHPELIRYMHSYADKRKRFRSLIQSIQGQS